MDCREARHLLDPFVDRELDAAARESVGRHLDECSDCANARDRITLLGQAARDLRQTLPPGLESTIRSAVRADSDARQARSLQIWRITAIAACLIAALSVIGAILSSRNNAGNPVVATALADEAIAGHVRSLMAGHLVDVVSSDQHTVKPWFAGKIDFSPEVRDFADHDYTLVGGRLDYLHHRPVVALVYRHAKHTINAFTWPADEPLAGPAAQSRQGYHVLQWQNGQIAWCLVSDASDTTLGQLKELIEHAK